jgi:hypothetical protein
MHTGSSSPHTPPHAENSPLSAAAGSISMQLHSATFPSTPAPANPSYPPYDVYPTQSPQSRSTSASNSNPRSASPALSVTSAPTSVSSASPANSQTFAPFPLPSVGDISPIAPRQKQRKQRLFNVDRKAICEYHKANPNARQEDIAVRYRVERSTISKILKHKTKWLNVPEHESMRVAKHRYVYFEHLVDP